jgi:hypothetical protein
MQQIHYKHINTYKIYFPHQFQRAFRVNTLAHRNKIINIGVKNI